MEKMGGSGEKRGGKDGGGRGGGGVSREEKVGE